MQITVMDVFREMRREPEPRVSWAVGAAVRRAYEERYGALPPKALRPKTAGPGSHCFALYPPDMRPFIVRAIEAHEAAEAAQGDLFG